MFGMGWQEILLIVAIAILVIGPDQLPQVARGLGKLMAQFRRATSDLRDAVNEEVHQYQEMEEIKEFSSNLQTEVRSFGTSAQEYLEKEIEKGEQELKAEDGEEETPPTAGFLPTDDYGPVITSTEDHAATSTTADSPEGESAEQVSEASSGDTSEEKQDPEDKSHKETA